MTAKDIFYFWPVVCIFLTDFFVFLTAKSISGQQEISRDINHWAEREQEGLCGRICQAQLSEKP